MMNYNYDVLNSTLTVSEKFLKLAGKYNSAEYNSKGNKKSQESKTPASLSLTFLFLHGIIHPEQRYGGNGDE